MTKKATQCCVAKSDGYDLNMTTERGRGNSYLYLFYVWMFGFADNGAVGNLNVVCVAPWLSVSLGLFADEKSM